MLAVARASLRFFIIGFVVGTLFAPRSGAETRKMLGEKLTILANQLLEIAALPPIEPKQAGQNGGEAPPARRAGGTRGSNARTSS
ncbi:MAG TPA: YtxH domain-containing protein [Candidatus Limnocylindria bacterium]|nr:YtxH domain-containing protein [Candidatus Limnocylindria bacterium]